MKVETITFEYKTCGECPNTDSIWKTNKRRVYCTKMNPKKRMSREDLWGDIPAWCPLEEKKNDVKV